MHSSRVTQHRWRPLGRHACIEVTRLGVHFARERRLRAVPSCL